MQIDRDTRSRMKAQFTKYNCEKKCPHLEVKKRTARCKFYGEYLAPDGSGWFMCGDCSYDTYGAKGENG